MTLTWSSVDNLDFIDFKRKWEGRSGDRSIEKSFKRWSCEKEQSNGTTAEGGCEGQGHFFLSFTT